MAGLGATLPRPLPTRSWCARRGRFRPLAQRLRGIPGREDVSVMIFAAPSPDSLSERSRARRSGHRSSAAWRRASHSWPPTSGGLSRVRGNGSDLHGGRRARASRHQPAGIDRRSRTAAVAAQRGGPYRGTRWFVASFEPRPRRASICSSRRTRARPESRARRSQPRNAPSRDCGDRAGAKPSPGENDAAQRSGRVRPRTRARAAACWAARSAPRARARAMTEGEIEPRRRSATGERRGEGRSG